MSDRTGIFVGLALLLLAYVGGYFALQRPAELVILDGASGHRVRSPGYRIGGPVTATVFQPALWVDHRIRPRYWDWEALQYGANCMHDEVAEE